MPGTTPVDGPLVSWIGAGPNCVASRVPDQGSAGTGAAKRCGPIGGRAYGMPRYAATVPDGVAISQPASRPAGTVTVGCDTCTGLLRSIRIRTGRMRWPAGAP